MERAGELARRVITNLPSGRFEDEKERLRRALEVSGVEKVIVVGIAPRRAKALERALKEVDRLLGPRDPPSCIPPANLPGNSTDELYEALNTLSTIALPPLGLIIALLLSSPQPVYQAVTWQQNRLDE